MSSEGTLLGAKEFAVLAMLQQGIDLVGDHMASRINRRLDDAHFRMHSLETKFSSLRSVVSAARIAKKNAAPAQPSDAGKTQALNEQSRPAVEQRRQKDEDCHQFQHQHEHSPKQQQDSQNTIQQVSHQRIPLSAAPTNKMQCMQRVESSDVEHGGSNKGSSDKGGSNKGVVEASHCHDLSHRLPSIAAPHLHTHSKSTLQDAPRLQEAATELKEEKEACPASSSVWGGAEVELECQDAEDAQTICRLSVSVAAPWDSVRQAVAVAVYGACRRNVEAQRFGDGSGGTIGLTTDSSWVLCKALRTLTPAPTIILTCLLAPLPPQPAAAAETPVVGARVGEARGSHVTFKNSPIMHSPVMLERRLPHTLYHDTQNDLPQAPAPKKKISDMKPPPMKRKKHANMMLASQLEFQLAPHPPSKTQYAKKKSYEVEMPSSGASVVFKKLVYSNPHPFTTKFTLARVEQDTEPNSEQMALEFQSSNLMLAAGEQASIAVKLVKKTSNTKHLTPPAHDQAGASVGSKSKGKPHQQRIRVKIAVAGVGSGVGTGLVLQPDLIELIIS